MEGIERQSEKVLIHRFFQILRFVSIFFQIIILVYPNHVFSKTTKKNRIENVNLLKINKTKSAVG